MNGRMGRALRARLLPTPPLPTRNVPPRPYIEGHSDHSAHELLATLALQAGAPYTNFPRIPP